MPTADRKLHKGDRRDTASKVKVPASKGGAVARQVAHERSEDTAHKVETLAALGNSQDTIAFACDMHVETLKKYYNPELQRGLVSANHRVGASILQTAEGERVVCVDCEDTPGLQEGKRCKTCHGTAFIWRREPNTTAQIWWSKNRMGWTDKERIEHVGDGGGPVITEQRSSADTVKAKLSAIRKRLQPPANDKAA